MMIIEYPNLFILSQIYAFDPTFPMRIDRYCKIFHRIRSIYSIKSNAFSILTHFFFVHLMIKLQNRKKKGRIYFDDKVSGR
jgi:hypothetical protein